MYFKDRVEAGRKLATRLDKYKTKSTVVVALGESSVLVAAQIAMRLHTDLVLYMVKSISLPGETEPVAALSSTGVFRFNDGLSSGEIEEITGEFRGYIEQERMQKHHELNVLLGRDGEIEKDMLRHRDIILVADGLANGFSLTMVEEFLKTVVIGKVVIAVPVGSVPALDKMHVMADELHILGVTDNYMGANHYYEENDELTIEDILKILRNLSLTWSRALGPAHASHHHTGRRQRSHVLVRHRARP